MSDWIADRVDRGEALMDECEPGWWRADRTRPINLDRLNLGDSCHCVLGQTWNGEADETFDDPFDLHSKALFGSDDDEFLLQEEIAHGFNAEEGSVRPGVYAALTDEWRRRILARRAAGGSS